MLPVSFRALPGLHPGNTFVTGSAQPTSPAAVSSCHCNPGWGPQPAPAQLPALPHREAPVPMLGTWERNGTSGMSPTAAASDRWEPGVGFLGNRMGGVALSPSPVPCHKKISLELGGEQQESSTNTFLLKALPFRAASQELPMFRQQPHSHGT